jgi:hypothetical protein
MPPLGERGRNDDHNHKFTSFKRIKPAHEFARVRVLRIVPDLIGLNDGSLDVGPMLGQKLGMATLNVPPTLIGAFDLCIEIRTSN